MLTRSSERSQQQRQQASVSVTVVRVSTAAASTTCVHKHPPVMQQPKPHITTPIIQYTHVTLTHLAHHNITTPLLSPSTT